LKLRAQGFESFCETPIRKCNIVDIKIVLDKTNQPFVICPLVVKRTHIHTSNMAPLIQETDLLDAVSLPSLTLDEKPGLAPIPEKTPRRVTFGGMATVRKTISRKSYTQEEIKAAFYSCEDMRQMKETVKTEAKLLSQGLFLDQDNSVRGLEGRTRKGAIRKQRARINAYAAVFCEIDYQYQYENIDDEAIADAYYQYSEPNAKEAQELAQQDELEAWNVYDDELIAFCDQFLPR